MPIKKIIEKVKKQPVGEKQLSKITNSTLEMERREVLNNGRKFKYPVQYSKHKLIINTLIISGICAIIGFAFVVFRLYKTQDTGTLIYRITTVVPFYVANIDGENVRYSDYLMQYRSNAILNEQKKSSIEGIKDEKIRTQTYKSQSMDNAILNTYALKLARENNIKVSEDEIDKVFIEHRTVSGREISQSAFAKIVSDNYGLSIDEYRRLFIELPIIRQKVSALIDKNAEDIKNQVEKSLAENSNDFAAIFEKFGDKIEIGKSGLVKTVNIDGGRTKVASTLKVGEVSKPFISKGSDGYYIVKLLEKKDEQVNYEYIKIPFTEFDKRVQNLKNDGKIKEYIKIEGR